MNGIAAAPPGVRRDTTLVVAAVVLAALSGPLVLVPTRFLLAGIAAGAIVALVALRPEVGAYVLIAATPLLAGIERGELVPLARPHEALLVLVAGGLAIRAAVGVARGVAWTLRPSALEWSILALAVSGSVVPLLWMAARGREITGDDLLYASYLWKYGAVYVVVRACVRTERQVATCLWLAMGAAAIVGAVAILQSLGLLGVPALVERWFGGAEADQAGAGRGTATLGSSFAVADVMLFNLAIAVAWLLRGSPHRVLLTAFAVVATLGVIGAGQISGFLGLPLVALTLGIVSGRLGRILLVGVPAAVLATLALWPVVATRLEGFTAGGLPSSWVGPNGRLANLETFFWPDLLQDGNWLTGVQVSARVPAPEPWRDWVWIESGHTWLLWSGGVALFVSCFVFLIIAIRSMARVARHRQDAVGVAAVAALVALWLNVVLMTLDVHLTLRGAADLLFTLLALAYVGRNG